MQARAPILVGFFSKKLQLEVGWRDILTDLDSPSLNAQRLANAWKIGLVPPVVKTKQFYV